MIRNLTADHDWTFGKGKQNYLTKDKEIMLNIKTRLLSFLNDCFFATNDGIDWWNLLAQKDNEEIRISVRKTISATDNVLKVNDLDIYKDSNRKLIISFNVSTVYSSDNEQQIEVL